VAIRALASIVLLGLVGCSTRDPEIAGVPDKVDFNWHVRPILSDNCFRCHGPDAGSREAGLRLDLFEAATAELPESPGKRAIVPGNTAKSELIRRITATDADERMPPLKSHKPALSAVQVATIGRWIEQGAEYKPHWAYMPIASPDVPRTTQDSRAINEIDRFVFAGLDGRGMQPAKAADKETLINRLALTLTGLPPSLEEVDAFVADSSTDAYEQVVDRLLGSPAYAEHMASYWLSVARYSESDGFLDDAHDRLFWPYRDWVISAFQQNMPFDQFSTWQLAGDLLPNATREQRLATAFLRVGKRTSENGAIDEEYRVEYMVDRTDTVGNAFLALTVGCARCHDHKYDVISHKDYYSLAAFFNSVDEPGFYAPGHSGVTAGPTLPWPSQQAAEQIAQAEREVATAQSEFQESYTAALGAARQRAKSLSADRTQLDSLLSKAVESVLVAHYPFERVLPIPRDRFPESYGRGEPPPELVKPERSPFGPPPSAVAAPAETAAPKKVRRAFNPFNDDGLPADLVRKLLVWSPSATPGVGPAYLQSPNLKPGVKGNAFYFDDVNKGFLANEVGYFERNQPFSVDLWVLPGEEYENSTVFNHRDDDNSGGGGYTLQLEKGQLRFDMMHSRAGNMLRVVTKGKLPVGKWSHLAVTYDGSSRAAGLDLYIDGRHAETEIVRDNLTRTILPKAWAPNLGDEFLGFAFGKRFRESTLKNGAIDEIRIYRRNLTPLEVRYLHDGSALLGDTGAVREGLDALLAATEPGLLRAQEKLTAARGRQNQLVSKVPQVMVMGDTPKPRQAYVLERGVYGQHGAPVAPRGLQQVFAWNQQWPENRIGLSQWLFDPKNPLTARATVNRFWQMHFGKGLVETAEDFGLQGSIPSHPELLDWLAARFIESGWDIKALHKSIVMSATYRQSSDVTPELLAKDPGNVFLARGLRLRMPAEVVRDHALAASGLLVRNVGGPSTFPYQPEGIWDGVSGRSNYPAANEVPADEHHRRSIYSFVKRNAPHPAMAVFDFPDRLTSTVRRKTSNTPLQALVLLNDPQYVEAYRALAQRVVETEAAPDAQITKIFRLATRRKPRSEELTPLVEYYQAEREENVSPLAALTNVTAVVMNSPDAFSIR
jgi:hypothetical protein